jgi:hypothetical protein
MLRAEIEGLRVRCVNDEELAELRAAFRLVRRIDPQVVQGLREHAERIETSSAWSHYRPGERTVAIHCEGRATASVALSIVHEATHAARHAAGMVFSGREGEQACLRAEHRFAEAALARHRRSLSASDVSVFRARLSRSIEERLADRWWERDRLRDRLRSRLDELEGKYGRSPILRWMLLRLAPHGAGTR